MYFITRGPPLEFCCRRSKPRSRFCWPGSWLPAAGAGAGAAPGRSRRSRRSRRRVHASSLSSPGPCTRHGLCVLVHPAPMPCLQDCIKLSMILSPQVTLSAASRFLRTLEQKWRWRSLSGRSTPRQERPRPALCLCSSLVPCRWPCRVLAETTAKAAALCAWSKSTQSLPAGGRAAPPRHSTRGRSGTWNPGHSAPLFSTLPCAAGLRQTAPGRSPALQPARGLCVCDLGPAAPGVFFLCGCRELLPQGRCGRHLPPVRSVLIQIMLGAFSPCGVEGCQLPGSLRAAPPAREKRCGRWERLRGAVIVQAGGCGAGATRGGHVVVAAPDGTCCRS